MAIDQIVGRNDNEIENKKSVKMFSIYIEMFIALFVHHLYVSMFETYNKTNRKFEKIKKK